MSILNKFTSLNDQLVLYFDFQGDSGLFINDKSASSNDRGRIVNTAQVQNIDSTNRVVTFTNSADYVSVANSTEINMSTFAKRTISLKFKVDDKNLTTRRQVIYEEGGASAGFNIYIFAGKLYVGGWNNAKWLGTFLATDQIVSGKWHNVSLVLDAQAGVTTRQAGAFRGYLDGVKFGEGQGLEMSPHGGGIGLGNVNLDTKFDANGTVFRGTGSNVFQGSVDQVLIHNQALTDAEIAGISRPTSLGTNLANIADWSTQLPFLDGFKSSRPWITQKDGTWDTQESSTLDLDANGWIKSLPSTGSSQQYKYASTLLYRELQGKYPSGRYVVLYDGKGRLSYGMDSSLVSSTPGRDVIQVNPSNDGVLLSLRETDPNRTGDYIRNIRVVPEANENTYISEIFNPAFIEKIDLFESLRFMDWMKTNDSTQKEWANRPTLDASTWAKKGAPVEIMVALANKTDANPWFNMPHQATDEYVTKFAEYVKQNLEPGLKIYVEYSNEVWNPQFGQYSWVQEQARLTPTETTGVTEWYSRRTTQVMQIWDQVFGLDKERVIGVMGTQAGNPWIADRQLDYTWTANPLSHKEYGIDALAIAPYFGGGTYLMNTQEKINRVKGWAQDTTGAGLDSLFNELKYGASSGQSSLDFIANTIRSNKAVADANNLPLIAYEGGQHLDYSADETIATFFNRANRDPRIGELTKEYLSQWYELGGGDFVNFNDIGTYSKWGSWGALESVYDTTSPKYEALKQFIG